MVLEIPSRMLRNVVEQGNLELYIMSGTSVESHLAYAEDVLLICRDLIKSMRTLKGIFD